jgi:hypothetical protein
VILTGHVSPLRSGTTIGVTIFRVKNVPEVFSLFDDLSYEFGQLDLKGFRVNAVAQQIMER